LIPVLSYTSQTVTSTVGGAQFKTTDSGTSMAILFGREPSLGVVHTLPRIAFDYVIVKHLTLGGAFAFAIGLGGSHTEDLPNGQSRKVDAGKTTVVGFAPRVGYVIPLGDVFAFWPRAGFAFYSVSTSTPSVGPQNVAVTTTDSDTVLSLDLDPQFAWCPSRTSSSTSGRCSTSRSAARDRRRSRAAPAPTRRRTISRSSTSASARAWAAGSISEQRSLNRAQAESGVFVGALANGAPLGWIA
jgi:hypothetical protein